MVRCWGGDKATSPFSLALDCCYAAIPQRLEAIKQPEPEKSQERSSEKIFSDTAGYAADVKCSTGCRIDEVGACSAANTPDCRLGAHRFRR
ncbi:hypothetical protein M5G07_13255 [Serratia symbiotica]|nr:hypothetical protein [Serratia symbiotica]